jgi:hypothetical protein
MRRFVFLVVAIMVFAAVSSSIFGIAGILGIHLTLFQTAVVAVTYIAHVMLCACFSAAVALAVGAQERAVLAARVNAVADKLVLERAARQGLN